MSDPEDERSSQPGDLYATPVGTNEDDVATEADAVSTQISENITVRRSSGVAGPTVDSSRPSAISSLMATRGPAEEMDEHEKVCHDYKVKIDSFFGAHPLGKDYSRVFNRTCNKPMPPVPQDDVLLRFLALQSSEIDENDIRTVRAVLKSCMNEYDDLCAAMMDSVKHEKIKSRRSSVGEASKILQLDFNRDRQLQEQQNKTLNDMTSGNELIEGQFGAIFEFLKYTGRSNWYAIFEFFKSKFGVVDAKVIGGHLDYFFSVAGGANFGTELNSEDLSADQPSTKYIPMSTRSNVSTKTLATVFTLICLTCYCVYADSFRLSYDGCLTTFGEAYRNSVDPNWGQKSQLFAEQHFTYKGSGGDGGNGNGKKGSNAENLKSSKNN